MTVPTQAPYPRSPQEAPGGVEPAGGLRVSWDQLYSRRGYVSSVKRYAHDMVAYRLYLDRTKLQRVGTDEARRLVNRVVRRTFTRSQALVPVDNGPLRASGHPDPVRVAGALVIGGVVYTAEYAAAVHNGRRALTIRARNRKVLRFVVGGKTVFARQVHQKARAARPYLAQALREVAPQEGFRVTIG